MKCPKCKEEDYNPRDHDYKYCMLGQINLLQQENDKLKASVESWKTAWYKCQAIIGKLWWHHPALYSDKSLFYYRNNLKNISK